MQSRLLAFAAIVSLCKLVTHASAAISVSGATTGWMPVTYANPALADPSGDQQTGSIEGDIVGNAANPSLYNAFYGGATPSLTDGEIGFRVRVGGDSSPAGSKTVVWIGIDANRDGKVDLFAGALEDASVGFYPAGSGANISPNTTSINAGAPYYQVSTSTSNFSFMKVTATSDPTATTFNIDGGSGGGADHTDHFVTIVLPFSSLVTAVNNLNLAGVGTGFNETTPLQFIAATSTQQNSLNQDLNGINGGVNSTATWTSLGGFTTITSPNGVVPEPSAALLSTVALGGLFLRRSRKAVG